MMLESVVRPEPQVLGRDEAVEEDVDALAHRERPTVGRKCGHGEARKWRKKVKNQLSPRGFPPVLAYYAS